MMPLILLASLLWSKEGPRLHGDAALIDFLRDAQEVNRKSVEQGKATCAVLFEYDNLRKRYTINESVVWNKDNYLLRFAVDDTEGQVLGDRRPTSFAETNFMLVKKKQTATLSYTSRKKRAQISRYEDKAAYPFVLLPVLEWYNCCPPTASTGLPWSNVIEWGRQNGQLVEFGEVFREGTDRIKFRRHDKDGGILELEFSLFFSANLISMKYRTRADLAPSRWATYSWKKSKNGTSVLQELTYVSTVPSDPNTIDQRYRLSILAIDADTKVAEREFDSRSFLRSLPKDLVVQDDLSGKTYFLGKNTDGKQIEQTLEAITKHLETR